MLAGCGLLDGDDGTTVQVGSTELHVLRPDGDEPAPVLVHVPGGGWTDIDGRNVRQAFGQDDARDEGWAVVTLRYRVAGDGVGVAEQADDVEAGLRWLVTEGAEHGLGGPVLATGHSAGAHLLALAVARSDDPVPDAMVLAAGVYDLAPDIEGAPLLQVGLEQAFGCADTCDAAEPLVPTTWLDGTEPPTTLVHGTADEVTPPAGSERFASALQAAGVAAELDLVEGGEHGGDRLDAAMRRAVADARVALGQPAPARSNR